MKRIYFILFLAMVTNLVAAQVTKTITNLVAGTLTTTLSATEKTTISNLTITGDIDARDVKCMRDVMPALAVLDISGASIKAFTGNGGTYIQSTAYPANQLPQNSFFNSSQGKVTLKSIILPTTLATIGSGAFQSCTGLISITIPNSVISIGYNAFSGCTVLTSITIPAGLTSIGSSTFFNCSGLTSITIPTGLTSLGNGAFYGCRGLTSITIPDGLTTIESQSFWDCSGLTSITIGAGVNSIAGSAFYGCTGIKNIYSLNLTPPTIGSDAFYNVLPSIVYVPELAVTAYKAATGWSSFSITGPISVSTNSISALNYVPGATNSDQKYFTLSGGMLTDNVVLTAPINFEISTSSGTAFVAASNITLSPVGGLLALDTIYIRLKTGLALNTYTGTLSISSTGVSSKTIAVSGIVRNVPETMNVNTAGTLSTLFSASEMSAITKLTLTGNIDARDITCLRDKFTKLSILDLDAVSILAYNGDAGTYPGMINPYPANEMPPNSFYANNIIVGTSLTYVKLPRNLTSLGGSCFYNCTGLKTIICLNSTPPILNYNAFSKYINNYQSVNLTLDAVYIPIGALNSYKTANGWNTFSNLFEYILKIKTQSVNSITLSTATLNANIYLITDTPVTSYGFCWNTTGSPTVNDNKVDKGVTTALGAYSSNLSNLVQATKYYVKAYAIDGERTVYGSEVTFTTPSIPDAAGNISGAVSVCQGQNTVTYTVPPISYATSYLWTLPTGATGASTTNSITVDYSKTASSGNVTVTGNNQWGNGGTSTLAIAVNLLPVNAGVISGNASVCQGENSVTYTVPAIDNATSYIWTLPYRASGTSTTNSINVNFATNAVSGNITVKVHNDCGDGVVSTLAIKVNQLPVIIVADKTVVCGGSVSLNATTNFSGSGILSYQWSPTTGLNDATLANPTATIANDITYTVTINTPNSCSTSKSLSVTIIPMDKPEIGMVGVSSNYKNLIAWNKPVSAGIESYHIYRETNITNVYEKVGTVSYDSLSIYVDNQSLPDVQSNKYKLSIYDRHGLESPQSNSHKTMHLAINKGMGSAWNLSWEAYEGFVVSTYNIYRGTTPTNLTLLGSTSGSNTQYNDLNAPLGDIYYQLEVISPNTVNPTKILSSQKTKAEENGFSNSLISYSSSRSNIATNVISGINELGENKKINIYPNPVKNELRIDFEGGSTFEIQNLLGQVVYNGNLLKNTIVQTSNLSSGVYLIKFKTGKTFEYKKIIKE